MSEHRNGNDLDHEPYRPDDENGARAEDEASVTSSVAADREAVKEYPGVDFRVAPEEQSGFYMMLFFNISCFISFVFMLTASCPVAWYKASNGGKWTLWKNNAGVRWNNVECRQKMQMFQAMEAFSIISIVLSLGALIAGILQMVGAGHLGATMLTSFLAMATTLVTWSLSVHQYHKYNCLGESPYVNKIARLNAGFALSFISFSFMFFSFFSVVYYTTNIYALEELTRENFSFNTLLCTMLIGICLLISTVGTAFTMWESYFTNHTVKITLWHVEILHTSGLSEYWAIGSFNCKALKTYFKAGQAFAIIGDIFLFATLLCAVAAVYSRAFKWATVGLGFASFVFLLVCWAIMLAARYKTFCKDGLVYASPYRLRGIPDGTDAEQRVQFDGFIITEGLGMIISASCGVLCAAVMLIIKG